MRLGRRSTAFDSLTPQERRVMWQIVDGSPNKVTAAADRGERSHDRNRRRSIFASSKFARWRVD